MKQLKSLRVFAVQADAGKNEIEVITIKSGLNLIEAIDLANDLEGDVNYYDVQVFLDATPEEEDKIAELMES